MGRLPKGSLGPLSPSVAGLSARSAAAAAWPTSTHVECSVCREEERAGEAAFATTLADFVPVLSRFSSEKLGLVAGVGAFMFVPLGFSKGGVVFVFDFGGREVRVFGRKSPCAAMPSPQLETRFLLLSGPSQLGLMPPRSELM